ncbi:MAG: hypothetical protein ACOCV4_04485 [Myxococcota bacterium]
MAIHSTMPPRWPEDGDRDPRRCVLVIDSTGGIRESLHRGLVRYGVDVVGCEALPPSGAPIEGAERPVAVVVADDEEVGADRLRALRREDAPPTIVLSTGGTSEADLEARLGNLACLLIKPVGTEEVVACVRLALADEQETQASRAASGEDSNE